MSPETRDSFTFSFPIWMCFKTLEHFYIIGYRKVQDLLLIILSEMKVAKFLSYSISYCIPFQFIVFAGVKVILWQIGFFACKPQKQILDNLS